MAATSAENGAPGPCGLCGKNPAEGFASSWTAASGQVWYCHGDDDESPTCYERHNWEPMHDLDDVIAELTRDDWRP